MKVSKSKRSKRITKSNKIILKLKDALFHVEKEPTGAVNSQKGSPNYKTKGTDSQDKQASENASCQKSQTPSDKPETPLSAGQNMHDVATVEDIKLVEAVRRFWKKKYTK